MNELFDTVTLLGALQGAGLAVVLCLRKPNPLASRLLGTLVGAVALMLLLGYISRRWGWHGYPHLLALGAPLPFLFTPLLYHYVLALTRPLERLEPRALIHALPFLAYLVFMTHVFYLHPGEVKVELARAHVAGHFVPGMAFFNGLRVCQALLYLFAAYRTLRAHARRMEGYYSDLSSIDLRWLAAIVLTNALVWAVVAFRDLAQILEWRAAWLSALEPVVQLGSALFIFLIGYLFLWQPELTHKARAARRFEAAADADEVPPSIAQHPEDAEPSGSEQPSPAARASEPTPEVPTAQSSLQHRETEALPVATPRYQRNRLDDQEAERIAAALRRIMRENEPFRDASLTAQGLANELAVSPHTLSQVLNVRLGRTFYAFVNEHRVEALKAALADPSRAGQGVLQLALEAGFNSKSTLNSFFKKHTGMTPTRFREQAYRAA